MAAHHCPRRRPWAVAICVPALSVLALAVTVCRVLGGRRFLCRRPGSQMIVDGGNRIKRENDLHARWRSAGGQTH